MERPWSFRGAGVKASGGAFTLGAWRVTPSLLRLERDGETVRLEPKVMEALVTLAVRAPAVVSREELQEAVWGTAYVSEDLPRRAIHELRKTLGDDPRDPGYIETIPRSGYRLIASVEPWDGRQATEPEIGAEAAARRWRRLAPGLAAGLLVAAVLSLGVLRGVPEPASRPLGPTPFTTLPGLEYDPAFSPDGSRVAYLRASGAGADAEITLHVQLVGSETSLRLTERPAGFDQPIESPAWSPDGTAVAYRRWRDPGGWAVYRIPSLGGTERKLADLGPVTTSGLAWSPDGRWLAVGLRSGGGVPLAIHRIGVEGGERRRLTEPPPTIQGDVLPAWSPDGRSLAFVRNLAEETSELRVVPAAGGESRLLLPRPLKIADVDWTSDGRYLLVGVHERGRHRVWSVEVATGAARPLPELGDETRWLSAARRGGRLVLGRTRWEFGLRRYDLATGASTDLPGLSSTFYDEALDVSPDGGRLALVSTRSGSREVWVLDLDGRRPVQLTSFGGAVVGLPRWLADGRTIVFHAGIDGRFDLWTVSLDGTGPRRLTGPPGNHRVPSPGPDGDSVCFASDRSGEWQVWRLPLSGGPASQITRGGGYHGRESPDGRWVYFTRWQRGGLWRIPREGGAETQVLGDELGAREWGNWAPTPEGVYFVGREGGGDVLALWDPERGEVVHRVFLAQTPVHPSLALAPARDAAFVVELEGLESDLLLVEGVLDAVD